MLPAITDFSPVPFLRILVAGASPLARAGLASLLTTQSLNVVGQVADDTRLADHCTVYHPDVLIWDMGYDPAAALERLADLRTARLPVIALLADARAAGETTPALLAHGVRGILLQDAAVTAGDALAAAALAVVQGLIVLHPALIEQAVPPALATDGVRPPALTPREREVLTLIAEGLPNKQIAHALVISEHTVKFHVNAILAKLGAQSRTEAVVRATRLGWIAL